MTMLIFFLFFFDFIIRKKCQSPHIYVIAYSSFSCAPKSTAWAIKRSRSLCDPDNSRSQRFFPYFLFSHHQKQFVVCFCSAFFFQQRRLRLILTTRNLHMRNENVSFYDVDHITFKILGIVPICAFHSKETGKKERKCGNGFPPLNANKELSHRFEPTTKSCN